MNVYRTFDDNYYKEKSRILGNCINIEDNDIIYHYEFIIDNFSATIKCETLKYINQAIDKFRSYNSYISRYRTNDNSFYKSFDSIHIFKLPISIIQPSKLFIDKDKLSEMEKYYDIDEIYIPVTIINDEYVCLDGHHRLYLAYLNNLKMINVYLDETNSAIYDFVYLAKEQNINNIKDLKIIPNDLYKQLWEEFCNNYFNN